MNDDTIYRQAAIDAMEGLPKYFDKTDTLCLDYADVLAVLSEQLPSAQPERKKGEWIKEYWNGEHTRKCSACNITQTVTTYRGKVNFNYCPYCGAEMEAK